MRGNLWTNSHWILNGVIDSCAYSKVLDLNTNCPPFIGTSVMSKFSTQGSFWLPGLFKDKGDAVFHKSQFVIDTMRDIHDENGKKTGSVNYGILLHSTQSSFVFVNYDYKCKLAPKLAKNCSSFSMVVLDLISVKTHPKIRFRGINTQFENSSMLSHQTTLKILSWSCDF